MGMKTKEMICELRRLEEAHKNDFVGTGETNWSLMCYDVANRLEELLKAQEPKVMTVSEIGALANGDVVWIEFTDGRLLPMIVEDGCLMRWRFLWRICEDAFYDENYKARAWTSRPTDEQREATPWN